MQEMQDEKIQFAKFEQPMPQEELRSHQRSQGMLVCVRLDMARCSSPASDLGLRFCTGELGYKRADLKEASGFIIMASWRGTLRPGYTPPNSRISLQ